MIGRTAVEHDPNRTAPRSAPTGPRSIPPHLPALALSAVLLLAGWLAGRAVAAEQPGAAGPLEPPAAESPGGDGPTGADASESPANAASPAAPRLLFQEVGEATGARHVHSTRSFGDRTKAQVLEMFTDGGAAVAVGDFDGDGWDDLYLTDSGEDTANHLLRNLTGETGELAFRDVAVEAGVAGGNDSRSIVADALWLDYDNDGHRDLLLGRFGSPLLYRNLGPVGDGDGAATGGTPFRFRDVSAEAGLAESFDNTIAVIAFDYDGDGWLDLLLGHYFPPEDLLDLDTPHVLPNNLDDADNGGGLSLWRNVAAAGGGGDAGARRFVEVTEEAGLAGHTGWSLDVGHADLDGDGDPDLYVAGDYGTDRLFWNQGDGTFVDATEEAIGFDTRKGMNVDFGDFDRDGRLDVFVTNITDEYMRECNMLWQNLGDGTFLDVSRETGTCDSDWGWAGKFADLDNDGWEDLFTVNGLRSAGEENYIPVLLQTIITPGIDFSDLHSYPDIGDRTWSGYQKQRLFRNLGNGTFADVAAGAGVDNDLDGRGVGVADLDRDGRLDLVQTNARQPSLLYRNVSEDVGHWVGLELIGGDGSNRDAVGSRVTLTAGGATQVREVNGGNGYASQSTLALHFGLGAADRVEALEVRWPSGRVERWTAQGGRSAVPVGTYTPIVEGDLADAPETGGTPGGASETGGTSDGTSDGTSEMGSETGGTPGGAAPETGGTSDGTSETGGTSEGASEGGVAKGAPIDPASDTRAEDGARRLEQLRNLGKAMYENSATQYEAVDVLARAATLSNAPRDHLNHALALLRAGREDEGVVLLETVQKEDPSLPHTWFNLGIAYKRTGRYDEALDQLRHMAGLVPDEPVTWYNLGVLHQLGGRPEEALAAFERAAELDPYLAGARFQLATAYRQAGRPEEAKQALAEFRELKRLQADDAVAEDLEWSYYSELHDPREPRAAAAPPATQPAFEATRLAGDLATGDAALHLLEADGDPLPDLLLTQPDAALVFLGARPGGPPVRIPAAELRAAVPGDFDDDGLADLALVTAQGVFLHRNTGGAFRLHAAPPEPASPAPSTAPPGAGSNAPGGASGVASGDGDAGTGSTPLPAAASAAYRGAAWLDYDHDYDVDLLLLGSPSALLRNVGEGTFAEATEQFPFGSGTATEAIQLDLVPDTPGLDLVVAYADRPGRVFRDLLGGRYQALDLPSLPAGARGLDTVDLDNDGWTDLAATSPAGPVLLRNLPGQLFGPVAPPRDAPAAVPVVLADLENRGTGELLAGTTLARNRSTLPRPDGSGHGGITFEPAVPLPLPAGVEAGAAALAAADFDGDGRADLALLTAGGDLLRLTNRTDSGHGWLRLDLAGVKNLKLAPGAEVEVKAGTSYQKRLWRGVPLVFGLGPQPEAETVRITWPNGLIQNETRQPAGARPEYAEAQRLSGSCPMVFAWNGREMEFISDILGVAPLGAAAGDGVYFQVDHDEYLTLAADQLVPREDGFFDVRMTEELREVGYLDQVRLIAVDRPAGIEVFHSDRFKGPPFPEHRLYGVEERIAPTAARDHRGRDVLDRVLRRDRTYPDGFQRDYAGLAERHFLELDFPPAAGLEGAEDGAVLVLHGWVDWADGSTFKATSQSDVGPRVELPSLQVWDPGAEGGGGGWRTVIADMGVPAGKPKAIVVELEPEWLSPTARLRVVTSLAAYWDEAFLAVPVELEGRSRLTSLAPATADLRFRGFSGVIVHPQRLQPEWFVYDEVRTTSMWDPTPGLYTRYGEVAELLDAVDDRFVVFGAGDEVVLRFDSRQLPPLPEGWTRDYLFFVDGWAKDGDHNTAHARSVEPLPFHGMSSYPYPEDERFPDSPAHRAWREEYQTREALRLTRPLRPESGVAAGRR